MVLGATGVVLVTAAGKVRLFAYPLEGVWRNAYRSVVLLLRIMFREEIHQWKGGIRKLEMTVSFFIFNIWLGQQGAAECGHQGA